MSNVNLDHEIKRWLQAVDQIMWRNFQLDSKSAGWDISQTKKYFSFGDSPEDFVKWYAEKYDLIKFSDGW